MLHSTRRACNLSDIRSEICQEDARNASDRKTRCEFVPARYEHRLSGITATQRMFLHWYRLGLGLLTPNYCPLAAIPQVHMPCCQTASHKLARAGYGTPPPPPPDQQITSTASCLDHLRTSTCIVKFSLKINVQSREFLHSTFAPVVKLTMLHHSHVLGPHSLLATAERQ